jgi:hypothetical protein
MCTAWAGLQVSVQVLCCVGAVSDASGSLQPSEPGHVLLGWLPADCRAGEVSCSKAADPAGIKASSIHAVNTSHQVGSRLQQQVRGGAETAAAGMLQTAEGSTTLMGQ